MKQLLLTISILFLSASLHAQINYTVEVLRLRAFADDCDGGAPFCLNAPQDPVFNIWISDQGGNENTYCWIYENDEAADYGLWIDIQNVEVANETNVNTSTITVEMSGFESDALFSPTCSPESGDDAVEDRQLAQQFDLSSIPHNTPYITTVDIAGIYFAEIEIHWLDLSANLAEISTSTFNVYPNPTEGVFTLNADAGTNAKFMVFDLSGRLVHSLNSVNSSQQVDLSHLEKGTYQSVLINDDNVSARKCMIIIK
jgi:hypothetical protein